MRARQERVPFVTIEDRDIIERDVSPLLGQQVALVASPEGAQLRAATAAEAAAAAAAAGASSSNGNGNGAAPAVAKPLPVTMAKSPGVVALLDCAASVGGAKAAACAQLEQVRHARGRLGLDRELAGSSPCAVQRPACQPADPSLRPCPTLPNHTAPQLAAKSSAAGGGFLTPPGVCVPFGTMELALAALPAAEQDRYAALLAAAETAPVHELDDICDKLQVGRALAGERGLGAGARLWHAARLQAAELAAGC